MVRRRLVGGAAACRVRRTERYGELLVQRFLDDDQGSRFRCRLCLHTPCSHNQRRINPDIEWVRLDVAPWFGFRLHHLIDTAGWQEVEES